MTDAINTHHRVQNTGVKTGNKASPEETSKQVDQGGKKADASAIVNLSNSNILQELGEQIRQLPDVNAPKVDAIKQALSRGEYQVDAETIAKKFGEIEQLLP